MTVKTLTQFAKDRIAQLYETKEITSIKELAELFHRSERTIGRVLEEKGLATPVPRLKGEAYRVMKMLEKYKLDADKLEVLLERISTTKSIAPNPFNAHRPQQAALFQPSPAVVQ